MHGGGHDGLGRSGHDKQNKQTTFLSFVIDRFMYFTYYETISFTAKWATPPPPPPPNEHNNQGHVRFCEICLQYVGHRGRSFCDGLIMHMHIICFAACFILTSTLQDNATMHLLVAAIV